MSEINIVPLVDVVLVLLIIFMLTAHVMEYGLQIDVPKVRPVKENLQELPVVSISKEGTTYLNDKATNINLIGDEIHRRFPSASGVYVRADGRATWDVLAQVVAILGEAKFSVNMVTQPEDMADRRRSK